MAQHRPTFHESWYRVANLKAKLRSTAQISRQYYRGDRWYVIRDPAGNQYHRLSDSAYRYVGLLDGTRTVEEAWELVGGQLADEAPTQPEVVNLLTQLHAANLLDADITPDAAVLLRRHRQKKKREMQGRLMSALFPRIPLWDPDRFLVRWLPVVKPLLGKMGALLWVGVIIGALAMLAPNWQALKEGAMNAIAPGNWPFLWATFVAIKIVHELGHGFACRRFGGEVHELGIMFLVFIPVPYVDASSSWSFPSKWARIFVSSAGMIAELFFAAILAFVWLWTASDSIWNQLAYNGMLIASVSTLLFNANPLLRYDGYYILSDLLEIPNLRQKSAEYTLGLVKRHIFRVKMHQPLPAPMQRFWSVLYAVASSIYRVFIGIMIALMVTYTVPILGVLMAIGVVITFLFVPIFKLIKYLLVEPELHRKRGRAWAFTGAVAVTVFVLVGMVPFWVTIKATGILEPTERAVIHARSPGFVTEIAARDGDLLEAGDVILICLDRDLELKISQLQTNLDMLQIRHRHSRVTDPAQKRIDEIQIATYQKQLDEALRQREELVIRTPIAGRLIAPDIEQLEGHYLPRGEQIATVAIMDRLVVRAPVLQRDAELASRLGSRSLVTAELPHDPYTEVRLAGQLDKVVFGRPPRLTPASQAALRHAALGHAGGENIPVDPRDPTGTRPLVEQFEVEVPLANPEIAYLPGQRAYIRFRVEKRSLAWQGYRWFMQLVQQQSQAPGGLRVPMGRP